MMIVLFSIYMIVWPILFVFCMDCIYQVVQDILKNETEVREINKLRAAPTSPAPTDADDAPHPRPATEQEIYDSNAQ